MVAFAIAQIQRLLVAGGLVCLLAAVPAQAGLLGFGDDDNAEITPTQYAGLLGLRDVDPGLFRKKILPLIEQAMQDGHISQAELKSIEKAAGNVASAFLAAARAPRFQDSVQEAMEKAGQQGKNFGEQLDDTFTRQLPGLFDDAMKLFRNQLQEQKKTSPQGDVHL